MYSGFSFLLLSRPGQAVGASDLPNNATTKRVTLDLHSIDIMDATQDDIEMEDASQEYTEEAADEELEADDGAGAAKYQLRQKMRDLNKNLEGECRS